MKLSEYLKYHRRVIGLSVIIIIIFATSFGLYHLPIEAVIYPVLLSVIVAGIFIIFDYGRLKIKHNNLQKINTITDVMTEKFIGNTDSLNSADDNKLMDIIEADYLNIIKLISEEYNECLARTNRKYSDMTDYYTVWVHQIKTPISSMRLNLQNEDTVLSRKLMTDLHRIEQYVEMVLTFLRLDSDDTDYVFKECDLDKIVRGAVKKFSSEFIGRKLSLVYEPLNATVVTDEKWLSFVIEQVLSNALKYTPSGSITITLEQENVLRIKDTGIGISSQDLPRIFENGFTGFNGRADKKASGIGLYLCKRICSNLGYTISAESVVDEGTTIDINMAKEKIEFE